MKLLHPYLESPWKIWKCGLNENVIILLDCVKHLCSIYGLSVWSHHLSVSLFESLSSGSAAGSFASFRPLRIKGNVCRAVILHRHSEDISQRRSRSTISQLKSIGTTAGTSMDLFLSTSLITALWTTQRTLALDWDTQCHVWKLSCNLNSQSLHKAALFSLHWCFCNWKNEVITALTEQPITYTVQLKATTSQPLGIVLLLVMKLLNLP